MQGGLFIAGWAEVVVQRTGEWGRSGGESLTGYGTGGTSAMACFHCANQGGEGKGQRDGYTRQGDVQVAGSKGRRRGVRYGEEGEGREPARVQEKGAHYAADGECGTTSWPHESETQVGPRTRGDSEPTCTETTSSQTLQISGPFKANFS